MIMSCYHEPMDSFKVVSWANSGLSCCLRPKRHFSISNAFAARPLRPPAIRTRGTPLQQGPNRRTAPPLRASSTEETQERWPAAILKEAHRLGLLTMTPERAVEFTRDFEIRGQSSSEEVFRSCPPPSPFIVSLIITSSRT